jgi:shikimate kinase
VVNLVLIGYRGSGKGTVGRLLADRLGRAFIDTDALIEQAEGATVREIFAARGEQAFREAESRIVRRVAAVDEQVIAAGGGAVLQKENVELLRARGWLVWLRTEAQELHRRIQADPDSESLRPPLTALGALAEVRAQLARRTPIYQAAADFAVVTDGVSPGQVAETILVAWRAGDR